MRRPGRKSKRKGVRAQQRGKEERVKWINGVRGVIGTTLVRHRPLAFGKAVVYLQCNDSVTAV
jgi:hypothetical protein